MSSRVEFAHRALDEESQRNADKVSMALSRVLDELDLVIPGGRERSLMVTKLQEAHMWALAGLGFYTKEG